MNNNPHQQDNKRTVRKLAITSVLMLGFGFFVLPAIYNLVCDITGIDGRTGRIEKEQALAAKPDLERTVMVEFDANVNAGLPWEFRPMTRRVKVHPGEVMQVSYYAKNVSDRTIVGQAVPGVSPNYASKYFNKTECFCFSNQTFSPGQSREMPLRFIVDPDLPKRVKTLTLSYTFFDTGLDVSQVKKVDTDHVQLLEKNKTKTQLVNKASAL